MPDTLNVGPDSFDKPKTAPAAPTDLSNEINALMQREPGEVVRCVWLFGDSYRCNWWRRADTVAGEKPIRHSLEVTEMHVSRSSFLKVTRGPKGLVINEVPGSVAR